MQFKTRETNARDKDLTIVEKDLTTVTNDLKRENIDKLLQYYYFTKLKNNKL